MSAKYRIKALRLAEKIQKNPEYAKQLGISVVMKEANKEEDKK